MANTDTTALANLVQTAYDRLVEFALRAQPCFRQVADKRPAQQSMPGSSVVFNLYNDMADVTSTLTEGTDVTAVAVPATSNVTVTLAEYGNATVVTRKLRLEALSDVDPAIANMVGFNAASSIDTIVQNVLKGGTNVIHSNSGTVTYNSGTTVLTTGTDVLTSAQIRLGVAKLRTQKAVPQRGSLYACYLHPEVSLDLRAESGSTAWLPPHQYSGADNIWAGEIGNYEGAYFIETPRAAQGGWRFVHPCLPFVPDRPAGFGRTDRGRAAHRVRQCGRPPDEEPSRWLVRGCGVGYLPPGELDPPGDDQLNRQGLVLLTDCLGWAGVKTPALP